MDCPLIHLSMCNSEEKPKEPAARQKDKRQQGQSCKVAYVKLKGAETDPWRHQPPRQQQHRSLTLPPPNVCSQFLAMFPEWVALWRTRVHICEIIYTCYICAHSRRYHKIKDVNYHQGKSLVLSFSPWLATKFSTNVRTVGLSNPSGVWEALVVSTIRKSNQMKKV